MGRVVTGAAEVRREGVWSGGYSGTYLSWATEVVYGTWESGRW